MVGPLWEKSFHIPLEVYALQKVIKTLLLSDREETKLQKSLTWPAHSPGMWQQWGLNSSFLAQMPDISSGFWIFFFPFVFKVSTAAFSSPNSYVSLSHYELGLQVSISQSPKGMYHCPYIWPSQALSIGTAQKWAPLILFILYPPPYSIQGSTVSREFPFLQIKCPRSFLLLQKWLWNLPSQWSFSE